MLEELCFVALVVFFLALLARPWYACESCCFYGCPEAARHHGGAHGRGEGIRQGSDGRSHSSRHYHSHARPTAEDHGRNHGRLDDEWEEEGCTSSDSTSAASSAMTSKGARRWTYKTPPLAVTWEGAYDRHFLPAAFAGISFIVILYGVLYIVGADVFIWCLLAILALVGMVPILVSLVDTNYQYTLQALLQRVRILAPGEERFWKFVVILIPISLTIACAKLGHSLFEDAADGAILFFSLSLLALSIGVIIMLTSFDQNTLILFSSRMPPGYDGGGGGSSSGGGSGYHDDGMPQVPIAVEPNLRGGVGAGGGGGAGRGGRTMVVHPRTATAAATAMVTPKLASAHATRPLYGSGPSATAATATSRRGLFRLPRQFSSTVVGKGRGSDTDSIPPMRMAHPVSHPPYPALSPVDSRRLQTGEPTAEWLAEYASGQPVPFVHGEE